ncbi:MAG TPA: DinB family protein [Vicinamibacterales bacterium]|nr:DinB family protein [Vicinamibacterales bacterium]
MPQGEIAQLLDVIDRAYNRRSWHGTNLRGSIRGLTSGQAAWRPGPGRHNIWEIVVHAAYWKYAVWRRLTRQQRGSFDLEGSNWFPRPERADERAWKEDIALLERMHRELRNAVSRVPAAALRRPLPGSPTTAFELIAGIAAHDLYHAGQIQLIKRLAR